MHIVYALEDPPKGWKHSLFLAGPTPRDSDTPSWRPEALKLLEEMGYKGVVFIPEPRSGSFGASYMNQTEWENRTMNMADTILFWVPRDLETLPGFTTNVEFGRFATSGKVIFGRPENAPKTRYLDWLSGLEDISVYGTLKGTLRASIRGWEDMPFRSDGERYVPVAVFQTPMFQAWYKHQVAAGNRLDEAKVLWVFRMPIKKDVFSYALWVKIWVTAESRWKENEFVFARTDVATTVLYQKGSDSILDTEVVLIREFRSPARTSDGFVHEFPGGGCEEDDAAATERAAQEVYEETGLVIHKERFRPIGSRQACGTLSSHHIHGFAVEMNTMEMSQAKRMAALEAVHGEDDEEQAFIEVLPIKTLLERKDSDWATIGLVFQALM